MKNSKKLLIIFLICCFVLVTNADHIAYANETKRVYSKNREKIGQVALTFDDGPHPRYTKAILDILEEYHITATFFVIGKNMELYGAAARRAAAEGHEIGNHTYAHPTLSGISDLAFEREIQMNEALIEEYTGKLPTVFRPPEGYCTPTVERIATKNGSTVILWNVDTRDWAGCPSDMIVRNVMKNTVPGSIILFHDYVGKNSTTIAALKEILPRLSAAGYRFVTVSELIEYATPVSEGDHSSS